MHIPSNILALIFVLSVLIVFHEGGHFAVAKMFKFPVEVFSVGFGKRLFGFKRKETDYRVSLIPLGGYVKVVGLGPDESDVVEGSAAEAVAQPGTRVQRLLIFVAGPFVNLVLALLFTAAAFLIGIEVPKYRQPVVMMVDRGSPAEDAGVKSGDRVEAVAGRKVATWDEIELGLASRPRDLVVLDLLRDGKKLQVSVRPEPRSKFEKKYDIGYSGLRPYVPSLVETVVAGYPAAKAGLLPGDRIVSVVGVPVDSYDDVVRRIRETTLEFETTGPKPLDFVVQRGGTEKTLAITPRKEGDAWKVGFIPRFETVLQRLSLGDAFVASWYENLKQARTTYETVARLFSGRASMRQLSGPIDIARISGEAARTGPSSLLWLMGMLSLQLGLLNLLPIPVLDGGHIFVTLLESVARRDFSPKLKAGLMYAGVFFLAGVMVIVLVLDVLKNIG